MKYGYIYIIYFTDPRSHLYNHYYIGQKKYNIKESLTNQDGPYYYHGSSHRAIKEYWPFYSLHEKKILSWAYSKEELDELEALFINPHLNDPLCINMIPGGTGGSMKGKKMSQNFCQKQKESQKGHEVKQETRKKISETHLGSNNGMYGKEPWNKGKKNVQQCPIKGKKRTIIDGKIRYV